MNTALAVPTLRFARVFPIALLLLCLGAASVAAADGAGWRAGVAREKITPDAGLWMTGYAARDHPAEGTAQDLWVKALALSDSAGRRGVLITADLCGITREITDRVAAELQRRHGLARSALMVNVSHTHCSPWLEGNLNGLRIFPPESLPAATAYRRSLEQKMISVASAALEALAPAALAWGEDAATFGINRRENSEKDAPARRAAGTLRGPNDPRVPVLAVRDAGSGALRAVLVSYACHNTTLAFYQWHGDYAGCAQLELERRHPGAIALFAIGCGGDTNPNPRGTVELAELHGRELADAADRALGGKLAPLAATFSTAMEDITLTFARKPTDEQIREAREKVQPNREMHQAWAATLAEQLRAKGDDILKCPYPIQVWRLGNLSWASLGGEVVIDYSLRLRRDAPGPLWVFGYCNDVMAYIPSERVLKEGRYEGDTSMIPYGRPSPWAPGLEEKIVSKTHTLLARVRAP